MPTKIADATYDEVMLDWAVAELLSPTWAKSIDSAVVVAQRHVLDSLRTKILSGGVPSLSVYDRSQLVSLIVQFRDQIISVDGPHRGWNFWRVTVPNRELSRFSILHRFFPRHAGRHFGEFSARIRDDPSEGDVDMRADVQAIVDDMAAGRPPTGRPVAVERRTEPPLLLEGYKRSMAVLWRDDPSIELFFCQP
jgi:hypothetical protein